MSNWSLRPLSSKQIHYAACDALVLLRLYDSMVCDIEDMNHKMQPKMVFNVLNLTATVNLSSTPDSLQSSPSKTPKSKKSKKSYNKKNSSCLDCPSSNSSKRTVALKISEDGTTICNTGKKLYFSEKDSSQKDIQSKKRSLDTEIIDSSTNQRKISKVESNPSFSGKRTGE